MTSENKTLGSLGEDKAAAFLLRHNYAIVERNYRLGRLGEIDIIAYDRASLSLVFVEVKTRRSLKYGRPAEAVTVEKLRHLRRAAEGYMKARGLEGQSCRIDVIEVLIRGEESYLSHIKGCT